jgi:hypothetical protein
MADWKDAAAVRGVELNNAQAARLAALDRQMTLMMAMIDWMEEPVQTFRLEETAAPEAGE